MTPEVNTRGPAPESTLLRGVAKQVKADTKPVSTAGAYVELLVVSVSPRRSACIQACNPGDLKMCPV